MRNTSDYYLSCDVLQESFTRYLEKYGEENESTSLLYTIARNTLIDSLRRQNRNTLLDDGEGDLHDNPENRFMVRDDYRQVLSAMQMLDKDERDLLALVVSSELSYREIAGITGLSEANVKVKVHRTRVKLKNIMKKGEL
jgi:RNA polymerase sigma-70 factor (ECF subfamily)